MSRLELAVKQIESAREYTQTLLADIEDDQWYIVPAGLETHLAWQVGHLAMAEYGLALFRQRGRKPEDVDLMPSQFRKQHSRESIPNTDPATQISITEILHVFDRVHEYVLQEVPTFADESLDEPLDPPTAAYANKFGALLFCAHHEMLHAGQIGLLRRALGKSPVR